MLYLNMKRGKNKINAVVFQKDILGTVDYIRIIMSSKKCAEFLT